MNDSGTIVERLDDPSSAAGKQRRALETRQQLISAARTIFARDGFAEARLEEIAAEAGKTRGAFYAHFRDKEDVLFSDWKRFLGFFFAYLNWEMSDGDRFLPITELFNHLKEYYNFYKGLERSQKSERLFRTGYEHLVEKLEEELYKRFEPNNLSIPIPIVASYLAREIFGHMRWWLDNAMPHSPEEMDRAFHELTMPGVKAALANASAS